MLTIIIESLFFFAWHLIVGFFSSIFKDFDCIIVCPLVLFVNFENCVAWMTCLIELESFTCHNTLLSANVVLKFAV